MRRDWVLLWALGSAALMVVGAFGPWVTALNIISLSGNDYHKHGWYLAALALAGGLVVFARRTMIGGGVWAIVVGLAGAGLSYHDRHEVTSALSYGGTVAQALVHVGWGLNVALAASVSLALSGVGWFFTAGDTSAVRTSAARTVDASIPTIPAGWYPDPNDGALLRYWNGFGWTTQTAKPAS